MFIYTLNLPNVATKLVISCLLTNSDGLLDSPVGEGGVLLHLLLDDGHAHRQRVEHFGRGRAEVAQHVVARIAQQHVLHLLMCILGGERERQASVRDWTDIKKK